VAALLTCGEASCLSHGSAVALYGIGGEERGIELSAPRWLRLERRGITIHRRRGLTLDHVCEHRGIRVTVPALTLVDYASCHERNEIERAVNDADKRDLIDPETLRIAVDDFAGWPGVPLLRDVLDRLTFTLTDSELERWFLPIARRAGLPPPLTQQWLHGYRVDFYWPELGLVVETDGLRYHRTPAQQGRDRRRDQAHTAAGLTVLRFTHQQIRYERVSVESTLHAVAARLRAQSELMSQHRKLTSEVESPVPERRDEAGGAPSRAPLSQDSVAPRTALRLLAIHGALQLGLVHLRAALDAEVLRLGVELVARPALLAARP
jgi:very-short-patch-repair endonuclease